MHLWGLEFWAFKGAIGIRDRKWGFMGLGSSVKCLGLGFWGSQFKPWAVGLSP